MTAPGSPVSDPIAEAVLLKQPLVFPTAAALAVDAGEDDPEYDDEDD